ncbi:MAG: PhzF family phenazine biosynthesis isomerase, partial [Candidatus Saccharibacteria bacterium]|nr:PhzF family phenazine biosynthesis isomerase [Candidatus Saccharibacteria bacterium]
AVAKAAAYNECAFLCPSERADLKIRYFAPGREVALCGHATVASVYALMEHRGTLQDTELTVETGIGIIRVGYCHATHEITMQQADAVFHTFDGDTAALMEAIGLTTDDLDPRYPIVFGSTGDWTTIVPIKTLASFSRMRPNNSRFPAVLGSKPHASVHPMTFSAHDPDCMLHGRHFSSPFSGTVEDAVTGTASGVMSAYLLRYAGYSDSVNLKIEQGTEICRTGKVHACATADGDAIHVRIAGKAVRGDSFTVTV